MGLIPNTTCRRCHRQYPSYRGRCPYCGTKKEKEIRRSVPESDSAVKGTEAAKSAAESINWQMLIGGVLLGCIILVTVIIVSVSLNKHIPEEDTADAVETPAVELTPVPVPTATPEPTPTPVAVSSVQITFMEADEESFMEPVGSQVQLVAYVYPLDSGISATWSSSDESIATVTEDGLVTVTGSGQCEIYAEAGGIRDTCVVYGY